MRARIPAIAISVLSLTLTATACGGGDAPLVGASVTAAKGGVPGKPGGGEETSGNNLSTPVIWSEGVTKVLRQAAGGPQDAQFAGAAQDCTEVPGVLCYLQQDANNVWQAESFDAKTSTTSYGNGVPIGPIADFEVDEIDWGDNLEARDWTEKSIVRVETVLWQKLNDALRADGSAPNHSLPLMTAYEMSWLYGEGTSEMWGTSTVLLDGSEATVYSGCARLTIQKIADIDASPPTLTWDPALAEWQGEGTSGSFFNGAVWEGGDGPGFYSAEINIPGRVIYGYNWNARTTGDGPGIYRLTFSLDGTFAHGHQCGTIALNTSLADAIIRVPAETEEILLAEAEAPDPGGGTAVVDEGNNLSYIDVKILPKAGGGGKGGPK
jgi:hypothetical protein